MRSQARVNINKNIRSNSVLLIDNDGTNLGKINTTEAMNMASVALMDLVEVSSGNDGTPICRIMNYGKWKYEQTKKDKKNKSSNKVSNKNRILKEIKFRPNTCDNDLTYRAKQVDKFIADGHPVKLVVRCRGREQEHIHLTGKALIERFMDMLKSEFITNGNATLEGKTLTLVIGPEAKKQ